MPVDPVEVIRAEYRAWASDATFTLPLAERIVAALRDAGYEIILRSSDG